jgi:hypothetical protein
MTDNISLDQVRTDINYDLVNLYDDININDDAPNDSPFQYNGSNCEYYEPDNFSELTDISNDCNSNSYFHLNCRGLSSNWESFHELLCDLHGELFSFDVIGISEIYRCEHDSRLFLPGYHDLITKCRNDGPRGGVGVFIKDTINYKLREDLSVFIPHIFESIFIEIVAPSHKNNIIGVIYRPNTAPRADFDVFSNTLFDIMNIINNEHKNGIIMGDMNIDLLKFNSHNKTSEYLDEVFSHGFLPVIHKPTRICHSSASLIDHIYTNNIASQTLSGIITNDVADHFGIFHSVKIINNLSRKNNTMTRNMSSTNIDTFKTHLTHTNFDTVLKKDCPNEAYDEFMKKYLNIFEMSFPLRAVKQNKKFIKREPWVTPALLASSRHKAKLFTKKLRNPNVENIVCFKNYNNTFNKLKRACKVNYYKSVFEKNKSNMKKSWTILKQAIGKYKDKSNFPQEFCIDQKPVSNKLQIANSFNEYFSKIGAETSNNVPKTNKTFTEFMPDPLPNSMFLEPVSTSTVITTSRKLKSKSSSGHDGISTKLLKETIDVINIPITHIINRSFETGIVPSGMKIAKVIPIFKANDKCLLNNYRPVSLLPAFSKLLEKIMYDKVISFLNSTNVLYKHQYGFRAKHSTIQPIIHLLNHCAEATNKNTTQYTAAVLCDLSKAFDVINHKILLHKLRSYGIRGITNTWFENYLFDRSQYVEFENNKSVKRKISCGVPQGSILGPLLYLIYVNDIDKACNGKIISFADDTTMLVSDSNLANLYSNANTYVNDLYVWFCANQLSLNAKKTKYILIRPKQSHCNLKGFNLAINGNSLQRVGDGCIETTTKFLGIYLDEFLTWKPHIKNIKNKISRALFAIKQVKHVLPYETLRTLYLALIHPHISYGIMAWGNANSSIVHPINILQKRAMRMIHNSAYNSHTDPMFKSSKIMKIGDIYEYQAALFMFDYTNHNLPISFDSVFKFRYEIQTNRLTRQSNQLHIPMCRTNFAGNLPLFALPKIWNKWSDHTHSSNMSRNQFKNYLKVNIFNNYNDKVKCSNVYCKHCLNK